MSEPAHIPDGLDERDLRDLAVAAFRFVAKVEAVGRRCDTCVMRSSTSCRACAAGDVRDAVGDAKRSMHGVAMRIVRRRIAFNEARVEAEREDVRDLRAQLERPAGRFDAGLVAAAECYFTGAKSFPPAFVAAADAVEKKWREQIESLNGCVEKNHKPEGTITMNGQKMFQALNGKVTNNEAKEKHGCTTCAAFGYCVKAQRRNQQKVSGCHYWGRGVLAKAVVRDGVVVAEAGRYLGKPAGKSVTK